jgi:hypothetical protein
MSLIYINSYSFAGIVTDGLVLHLDAGNSTSYPGSGTTWTDLSGNGNTGTLVNGVGYNSSNLGSLSFDGVDDNVNVGNIISAPNLKTISCWVKFNTLSGGQEIVSKSNSCVGVELLLLGNNLSYYVMDCAAGGVGFTVINYSTSNLNTTSWYYIVSTHNGPSSPMKLYVNSIEVASGTTPSNIANSTNLRIGTWDGGGRYLNGNIAQVSIYNRALTAAEVTQNFNALRGRYGL